MNTVTIGGREFRILERHEPGSFLVEDNVVKARAELAQAKEDGSDLHARLAQLVLVYLQNGHNEVSLDMLRPILPAEIGPVIRACIVASGGKPVEKSAATGEAARP